MPTCGVLWPYLPNYKEFFYLETCVNYHASEHWTHPPVWVEGLALEQDVGHAAHRDDVASLPQIVIRDAFP